LDDLGVLGDERTRVREENERAGEERLRSGKPPVGFGVVARRPRKAGAETFAFGEDAHRWQRLVLPKDDLAAFGAERVRDRIAELARQNVRGYGLRVEANTVFVEHVRSSGWNLGRQDALERPERIRKLEGVLLTRGRHLGKSSELSAR